MVKSPPINKGAPKIDDAKMLSLDFVYSFSLSHELALSYKGSTSASVEHVLSFVLWRVEENDEIK